MAWPSPFPTKTTYSFRGGGRAGRPTGRKGFPAAPLLRITKSNQCSPRGASRATRFRGGRSRSVGRSAKERELAEEREKKRDPLSLSLHSFSFGVFAFGLLSKISALYNCFSFVTSQSFLALEGLTKRPMHLSAISIEQKCINRGNLVHGFANFIVTLFSAQFDFGVTFLRRRRMALAPAGV